MLLLKNAGILSNMKYIVSGLLLFACQISAKLDIDTKLLDPESDEPLLHDNAATLSRCETGTWVEASCGDFPRGALPIGVDKTHLKYLGRAKHEGRFIPGTFYGQATHIPYDNKEYKYSKYEIFCDSDGHFAWVKTNGKMPENAVIAGEAEESQPLYACRVSIDNNTISSGSVHNGICYIPINGEATTYTEYAILTSRIPQPEVEDVAEIDVSTN